MARGSVCACWVPLLTWGLVLAVVRAETRICLNMIAKNEAAEIMECLEPLAPELSGWTLCDTGSTDETVELVQEFFDKEQLPGSVAHHTWQDFGHNRNLCIDEGLKFSLAEAKRQQMPEGSHFCDYLLFLDADQILKLPTDMKPGDVKAMQLDKDGYHMTEKGVGVTYSNLRLVSTKRAWRWVGEVHEYVERVDGMFTPQTLVPGVWFTHDADGGQGGKRFARDEVILSGVVQQRPRDTRARFYLANTLRNLDRIEEAITHYLERIRLGGWSEERFMSALNIADMSKIAYNNGEILSKQVSERVSNFESADNKLSALEEEQEEMQYQAALANLTRAYKTSTDNATDPQVLAAKSAVNAIKEARKQRQFDLLVATYLATAELLPYRPEPWAHLAKLHRQEKNDNTRCFNYAAAGLAQGPPRSNALFINTKIMKYELLDEVCVCGYYVDHGLDQGLMACRKLEQVLVADLELTPDSTYMQRLLKRVRDNLGWYAKKMGKKNSAASAKQCAVDSKGQCTMQLSMA